MSIFLDPKDYSRGDVEHIIINLYAYLSVEWYPVNLIDSGVYHLFEMYARELNEVTLEVDSTWADLSIKTVRTGPIAGRSNSKIFDNFGSLYNTQKLQNQNFDLYNETLDLQSYRQGLRFITEAANNGATEDGIYRVGHALTGIGSYTIKNYENYEAWRLSVYEGTIVGVGVNNDFILSDVEIPGLGHIVPVPADGLYVVGDTFAIEYSSLGVNTYLSDEGAQTNSMVIYNFADAVTAPQISGSIQNLTKDFSPAGMLLSYIYSENFVYDRFDADYNDPYAMLEGDHLVNRARTALDGFLVETDVIEAPLNTVDVDWVYDWATLEFNDSYIKYGAREYPIAAIPDTVPYRYFNRATVPLADFDESEYGAHWLFDDIDKAWDISGYQHNLELGNAGNRGSIRARRKGGLGVINSSSITSYAGGDMSKLATADKWFGEMWVYGVSNANAKSDISYALTGVGGVSTGGFGSGFSSGFDSGVAGDGYAAFGIDSAAEMLYLEINNNGTIERVEVSIADYFAEVGIRPHYFAVSYYEGEVYFVVDNNVMNVLPLVVTNGMPTGITGQAVVTLDGENIGIDELLVQNGVKTPKDLQDRFEVGRDRLYSKVVPYNTNRESFHQGAFLLHAEGPNELEVHQFSMRGIASADRDLWDDTLEDIYRVPFILTVPPPTFVTSITVTADGGVAEVSVGETLQMLAAILPANATYDTVNWTVIDGTGSATIDINGILTGVTEGTVTVVATAVDGTGITGTLEVTVLPIPTITISIDPEIEYTNNIL